MVKHSNLIMLVVEDEFELITCGNMSQLIKSREPPVPEFNGSNLTNVTFLAQDLFDPEYDLAKISFNETIFDENGSNMSNYTSEFDDVKFDENDFTVNRYRKKPDYCHNFFPDEKEYLPCSKTNRISPISHACYFLFLWFMVYFSISQMN